jgi:8-oxo-dGTP pyrophosphatase MutT (NUDIX family)
MKKPWKLLGKKSTTCPAESWQFRTPLGKEIDILINTGKDFVSVFALTRERKVLLIREYYFAAATAILKLVAGRIEPGGKPRSTAIRELLEEGGYKGKKVVSLGYSLRGKYLPMKAYHFLILDAEKVANQNLEPVEDIEVTLYSLPQFKKLLFSGRLREMTSEVTAYRALKYLKEL